MTDVDVHLLLQNYKNWTEQFQNKHAIWQTKVCWEYSVTSLFCHQCKLSLDGMYANREFNKLTQRRKTVVCSKTSNKESRNQWKYVTFARSSLSATAILFEREIHNATSPRRFMMTVYLQQRLCSRNVVSEVKDNAKQQRDYYRYIRVFS